MVLVPVPLSAPAAKTVADFLERFGGISGFVDSLLDVPSGYLQHWSQGNLIRWRDKYLAENVKRTSEGRKPIPPSLLMPALQKIAMEDDNDMLAIWARLLANFQDPNRRLEPNKIYVHLLSEMQPLDVMILQHMADALPSERHTIKVIGGVQLGIVFITAEQLASDMQLSETNVVLSVHNLSRLGCLLAKPADPTNYITGPEPQAEVPLVPNIITEDGTFYLNSLGSALVAACRGTTGP